MRVKHYMRNLRDMGPVRRLGLQLLAEGATQSEVARELGVSRTTASNWAASLADASPAAGGRAPSCAPNLSAAQLGELAVLLGSGARRHGYPSDEWTAARVAVLIECEFGVACSSVHAWRIRSAAHDSAGAPVSVRRPAAVSCHAGAPAPVGRAGGQAVHPAGRIGNCAWAGGTGYTVAFSVGSDFPE